ncbi:DUF4270 family protein [Cecembia calidifontis]|uniref:Uncharacterized protein DUF4270 n=1 Tax=Cecembia calidifontis TaxID=1187080 RepID=A0A4Q7P5P2_9BACT|nr:DUF4270 family protein [Cecembia calidifontis]RZS95057.1 uncharacterized protein DUF4270 [Cecembia calidifontis]
MKVTTTYILTLPAKLAFGLLIIFPILSSCEDPSNIGLELDPNNNQIGVFYQEIPLSAFVIKQDSLITTNTENLVFGSDEGDFFGKTEAIAYSRLLFNRDIARPQPNAVLDSVRFNFNVRFVNADELNSPKTFQVHRLNEQIRDISYYNFSSLDYEQDPIFTASFNFSARQDTLVFATLNENPFARDLFEALKDGTAFSDVFTFREFLPGIVFKGAENEKASMTVRPGNNTGFVFFYRNEGDTVSRAYPIATGINSNSARHFNQVINDPTGTPTEAITEKFVTYDLGPRAGSKNNTGILVRLDMSPLDAFLDTLRNVTFNQVILELGPLERNIASNRPPQFLQMFFTNETNRVLLREDGRVMAVQPDGRPQVDPTTGEPIFTDAPALLAHDREKNIYRQFLTSHVNAIYRGSIERRDFILYPLVSGSDEYRQSLREFVLDSRSPILKIYYSKTRAF